MKSEKEFKELMKSLGITNLDVNKFIEAFDVTVTKGYRSYHNQKYASIGDSAMHLLLSEILFDHSDKQKTYHQEINDFESYDNWIEICTKFNLTDYTYTIDDSIASNGFVIQSSLVDAIAGVIFINLGYDMLKSWYFEFALLNKDLINNSAIKIACSYL